MEGSLGKKVKADNCFLFVDSRKAFCRNRKDFLKEVLKGLAVECGEDISIGEVNYKLLMRELLARLEEISLKKNIILSVRGVDSLEFSDYLFWRDLASLRINSCINFLFIIYQQSLQQFFGQIPNRLYRLISRNIFVVEPPTNSTINYIIERWGKILGYDFNADEAYAIKDFSLGKYSLIKAACCFIANNPDCNNLSKLLSKKALFKQTFYRKELFPSLMLDQKNATLFWKGKDLSAILTDTEVALFLYLLNNPYMIISKESLKNAIVSEGFWGKKTDNAISQYVFRLRRKLEDLRIDSVCIKTIYGKGYILTTPVNHPSDSRS